MGQPTDDDVFRPITIIENRLIFCPCTEEPESTPEIFYFTVDLEPTFTYRSVFREFGPPTLAQVHRFYHLMVGVLNDHEEMVQFFCFDNAYRFTTAVALICTFEIIHLGMKPDEAYAPFARLSACFMGFTDASPLPLTHKMSVISYLRGFYKGYSMKWYNPHAFNLLDWEFYSRSENGDMNWIIPGRLLALASPWMQRELPDGYRVVVPSDLTKPFKERGITHIIRLNERLYDERIFTRAGFKHSELFFNDGECPPYRVREAFLRLMNAKDVIAVHCKAGLGRTYVFAGP